MNIKKVVGFAAVLISTTSIVIASRYYTGDVAIIRAGAITFAVIINFWLMSFLNLNATYSEAIIFSYNRETTIQKIISALEKMNAKVTDVNEPHDLIVVAENKSNVFSWGEKIVITIGDRENIKGDNKNDLIENDEEATPVLFQSQSNYAFIDFSKNKKNVLKCIEYVNAI